MKLLPSATQPITTKQAPSRMTVAALFLLSEFPNPPSLIKCPEPQKKVVFESL